MSIVRRVKSVNRLFHQLDQEIAGFQSETGLHCISGCGKCCTKPDIDATPLEFLPFAFHLFLTGQAEAMLLKLKDKPNNVCVVYAPLSILDESQGSCSSYSHRGLICRLFGYGASRDKLGELRLATCKLIKEGQAKNCEKAITNIKSGQYVPIFSDYYQRLAQIDFRLGHTILPINEAIKIAIEEVMHHYAYRPFPSGFRDAS
ncbi:MAG: YkgJ family cysteine cluster protein [Cyclobacteriaceae bacterium]